jgi:hypothetical protein
MNNSFWIPSTGIELEDLANVLAGNPREAKDLIKCHAWFGDFFGGHLGKVQANVSIIKGKPCLLSDALVGICYQSGLVRRIQVMESNSDFCTIEAERNDEPIGTVHRFTFTIEMARQMNLVKASWLTQRENMLKKRARSFICREVFAEAVSGLYTIDEIADHSNLSDQQHEELIARSLGYDDGLNTKQPSYPTNRPQSRAPTSAPYQKKVTSRPPQPVEPVDPVDLPEPPQLKAEPLYEFANESDFWAIVDDHNISVEEVNSVAKRQGEQIADMTPDGLEAFFYKYVIHRTVRQSWSHVEQWWKDPRQDFILKTHDAMALEYPIIADAPPAFYGPRLHEPAFVEALRQSCSMDEKHKAECQRVIRYMRSDDWSKYYELVELAKA